jgi:hypothetical protein
MRLRVALHVDLKALVVVNQLRRDADGGVFGARRALGVVVVGVGLESRKVLERRALRAAAGLDMEVNAAHPLLNDERWTTSAFAHVTAEPGAPLLTGMD